MSSEVSQASWHPAFMPNSASDLPPRSQHSRPSRTDIVGIKYSAADVEKHNLKSRAAGHNEEDPDAELGTDDEIEYTHRTGEYVDNDEHPELDNLRSALTTSLASPGGVEMDENPVHAASGTEETEARFGESATIGKGEIPSERPAHEPSHASSASFARTVPRDVDWGEDDDVDPEWSLHRTEIDPFPLMAPSDRTNSFPQVPPLHNPEKQILDQGLSKSHTGEMMSRAEQVSEIFADNGGDSDIFDRVSWSQQSAEAHGGDLTETKLRESGGIAVVDGYNAVCGSDSLEELKFESRYEEGIPLVGRLELSNSLSSNHLPMEQSMFAESDAQEDDDFFGSLATRDDIVLPPALGRKSTMQVINSIESRSHERSRPHYPERLDSQDIGSSLSSLSQTIGGDIAAPSSAVVSQVHGESNPRSPKNSEFEILGPNEPSAEDLAAKWKAALDEDGFLDEDELLEDKMAADVNSMDPTMLFGSDDEGFLEDEETTNFNTNFLPQTSTDMPPPSIGSDGNTVRLTNMSKNAQYQQAQSRNRYTPATDVQTTIQPPSNPYAPQTPLLTDLSAQTAPIPSPYSAGFQSSGISSSQPSYVATQEQRPQIPKSQSFADKSKGGYASPYDLPMEVVKPRKRASMQQMARGYSNSMAPNSGLPLRSSSISNGPSPTQGSISSLSPPVSATVFAQPPLKPPRIPPTHAQTSVSSLNSKSSFFEDLPIPSRTKPAGRHTPQLTPTITNNQGTFGGRAHIPHDSSAQSAPSQPHAQVPHIPSATQGLVAPPKTSPYASLPTTYSQPPIQTTRYSPAPAQPSSDNAPPPAVSQGRYATAPPLQHQQLSYTAGPAAPAPSPPPTILAHQPRTSSPLIHFETAHDQGSSIGHGQNGEHIGPPRRESSSFDQGSRASAFPMTQLDEHVQSNDTQGYGFDPEGYQELPRRAPSNMIQTGSQAYTHNSQPQQHPQQTHTSPPKRSPPGYVPNHRQANFNQEANYTPPQRSQTQSPSKYIPGTRADIGIGETNQRPSSAHSPTSHRQDNQYSVITATNTRTRVRGLSQGLNYIAPTDGRELDPLQRWRGGPVFAWGVGGTAITSFPKEIPRYGMSQTMPMIICSPGEIKIRNVKDIYPLEERLASFPGPLKGKSKKKDVTAWLNIGIDMLERDTSYLGSLATLSHEDKRIEERVLLWKILRIMIENDGLLEGNPVVNNAVRAVLSPGFDGDENVLAPRYTTGADLSGISRTPGSISLPEPVDPASVDQLRRHLLRGEREKAVWEAVDKRLWAHALLISHTLSKEVHKQVAQEFIQKEVKSIGDNTESLAALYEIFAGNFEESVDELVPPSARAGFQMVSTSSSSAQSKSAIDGLDRWRETLGLILSNRSADDSQAINALGKLLSGYGRAEAAHVCFLFARGFSVFGGLDDPLSNIVLVGSDHLRQPQEFDKELEPILLSEVYEYGLSLYATSNVTFSAPHLAVYKLQHATILAQSGQRDKALQYCEAIAGSITSQIRRSPYHHALLVAALDDLSKRLKQSPKDESSSWISKPSIDKVSGSVWAKFNKFVAGDENDAASGGGGSEAGSEIGPFARIAGGTPTISRSPSNGEIYGSFNNTHIPINGNIPHLVPSKSGSRYAPGGAYTPPGTQDAVFSSSFGSPPQGSFMPKLPLDDTHLQPRDRLDRGSLQQSLPNDQLSRSYLESSPTVPQNSFTQQGLQKGSSYIPQPPITPTYEEQRLSNQESPISLPSSERGFEAYVPHADSGYQPQSSGGYEPPPYDTAVMNDEPDSPIDTRSKENSFANNDDPTVAATVGKHRANDFRAEKSKAEKDRETEEAFRKAAEADAKKDAQPVTTKKTWGLGGWFSKKDVSSDTPQPNKPIRAKLGEESSFVYDPELKRWVNKKAGKDGNPEPPSATPPPPRAGPPRTFTSSPVAEPNSAPRAISNSAPPSRAVSASITSNPSQYAEAPSGLSVPPSIPMSRSVSTGSAAGPPSRPPSRPATSMSNASSIDDLIGPPTARKGTAKRAKKGRGYIDVMGDKATT